MPTRKPTGGTKGKTPAKKTPARQRPGIGGGKRGQRLAQGAADYVSPNIGTAPGHEDLAKGALYGAYDSGSTLDQIKRNEYLNTLSLPDRERAMAHMGYFTGGTPTAVPKATKRDIRQYAKQPGHTSAGTYIMPNRSGQFEIGPDGKLVKGSVEAYRSAKGKVVGPEKGAAKGGAKAQGKGARSAKLTSGAKKKSSPGGRKVTAAERKRIQAAKAKQRGRGKGKGGGGGGGGAAEESAEALAAPYAEADTTTTSMLRAQGKAYASSREGYGNSRRGQESAGETGAEETEESKRQRRRNRRKKTVKKNKRGNYVTRVRKGGKVVSKRTTKRKPGSKK